MRLGVNTTVAGVWVAALALAGGRPAAAQEEIEVTAGVSARQIYRGDDLVFQVRVKGAEKVDPPDTQAITDFTVTPHPPSVQSSISIINGRTTRFVIMDFPYTLQAKRAGELTIPPVTVRYRGRQYQTEPIVVTVREPAPQDWAIVDLQTSRPDPWVEQPVKVTVDVYLRQLVHEDRVFDEEPFSDNEPPRLVIPWLEGTAGLEPVEPIQQTLRGLRSRSGKGLAINNYVQRGIFNDMLVTFDLKRQPVRRKAADGQSHPYYRYRLELDYRPTRSGEILLAGPRLDGRLYISVRQTGRGFVPVVERIVALAQPVKLEVKPIPLVGRPATYTGGVGRFTIRAEAKPTEVRVGDPIDLTLYVTGTGSLASLESPNLADQKSLTDAFKVYPSAETGRINGNTKVFTHSLRAKRDDVTAIGPILLSYFDPDLGTFQTVATEPIPIKVAKADTLSLSDVVDTGPPEPKRRELKQLAGGIKGNYSGTDLLENQPWAMTSPAGYLLLVLAPPVVYAATAIGRRRYQRMHGDPGWRRARLARRVATSRLEEAARAVRAGQFRPACDQIAAALRGLVADRLDLPSGEITVEEIGTRLQSAGVGEAIVARTRQVIEPCDAVRFAGREASAEIVGRWLEEARQVVRALDRSLRR